MCSRGSDLLAGRVCKNGQIKRLAKSKSETVWTNLSGSSRLARHAEQDSLEEGKRQRALCWDARWGFGSVVGEQLVVISWQRQIGRLDIGSGGGEEPRT